MNQIMRTDTQVAKILLENKTQNMLATCSPQGVDPEKVAAIVVDLVRKDDYLAKCSPHSIVGSVIEGTQLGLSFQKNLGHAYLVPRKGVATLVIGYKGLAKLARNSGEISLIESQVVYVNDDFEYQFGTGKFLRHIPAIRDKRGERLAVWCMVTMSDGKEVFDVIDMEEINRIRVISTNRSARSPWNEHFNEMAKKTVFRRLAKYLPLSIEAQAILGDEESEDPIDYGEKHFPGEGDGSPATDETEVIEAEYARQPEDLNDLVEEWSEPTPEEVRAAEAGMESNL